MCSVLLTQFTRFLRRHKLIKKHKASHVNLSFYGTHSVLLSFDLKNSRGPVYFPVPQLICPRQRKTSWWTFPFLKLYLAGKINGLRHYYPRFVTKDKNVTFKGVIIRSPCDKKLESGRIVGRYIHISKIESMFHMSKEPLFFVARRFVVYIGSIFL